MTQRIYPDSIMSRDEAINLWDQQHGGLQNAVMYNREKYIYPNGAWRTYGAGSRHLSGTHEPDSNLYERWQYILLWRQGRLAGAESRWLDFGTKLYQDTQRALEKATGESATDEEIIKELEKLGNLVKWFRKLVKVAEGQVRKHIPASVKHGRMVDRECREDAVRAREKLSKLGFAPRALKHHKGGPL